MILIIGQRADPHVTAVCSKIRGDYLVFDAHKHDTFHYAPGDNTFEISGKRLAFSDISYLWWRLKWPDMDPERPTTKLRKDRWEYWKGDYQATLISLSRLLAATPKVNDPIASFIANHKPYQLHIAAQIGFDIPETRISNNHSGSLQFLGELGKRAILKRISTAMLESEHDFSHLGLAVIDAKTVSGNRSSVEFCPSIFQTEINKAYELRVVVVGEAVFSVKVMSQSGGASSVDWRRNQHALTWEKHCIPDDLRHLMLKYLDRMNLITGVFDFAVTSEGRIVFFECNPEGQWLWLEKWAKQPISKALAELLEQSTVRAGMGEA